MGKKDQKVDHHQKDQKVEAVLHLLKKQAPLTLKQEKFCENGGVERFLRAKGENVKKAVKQLRSCLSWRHSIGIESLTAEEFSAELADGVAYVAGHDEGSRPVMIFRFKQDFQKLHTQKRFSRLVAFTLETAISFMSKNVEQFVVLFDASFFRSAPAFTNLLLATLKILAEYYPCRLYKTFIIDPPSLFSYIWKGVRPFVDLSTVTTLVSSLDYEEPLDFSHVSSCPRSASLRFDPSSIRSTARIGSSSSSRFTFTVSHHGDSLKPWYLSFTDMSPLPAGAGSGSAAARITPLSARSLSFASPAARGIGDAAGPAACRKSLFPSTPLPEKTTDLYRRTPRPSFFQSPATFFRRESHVGGGGGDKSRESFVPYLKFYRRPYDEIAYRSKLRGPRAGGFVSVVCPQIRRRHVSVSQRF